MLGVGIRLLHLMMVVVAARRRIFGGEWVPPYTFVKAGIIGRYLMIFKVGLLFLGVLPDILRGIPALTLFGCCLEPIKHGDPPRACFVRLTR